MYDAKEYKNFCMHTVQPENISAVDLAEIVVPGLREELKEKLSKSPIVYQEQNYKANNILDRANALCKDVNTMTVGELNQSVYILREELYLIRIQLQKQEKFKRK